MDPRNFFAGSQGDQQHLQHHGQQQAFASTSQMGGIPPELLQWHQQQQQQQHFHPQQALHDGSLGPSQAYPSFPSLFQQQQQTPFNQAQSSASPVDHASPPSPSFPAAASEASKAGPVRSKVKSEKSSKDSTVDAAGSGGAGGGADDSSKASSSKAASSSSGKAAPVRAACLFCRARKSRCNGQHPCHNCINRGREDDCIYTVSRRGGKPKPKPNQSQEEANMEQHLKRLFNLSQMPSQVRIPGAIPQLVEAQREQQHQQPSPFQPQSPSQHSQHHRPPPPPIGLATSPQALASLAAGQPGPVPLVPPSPSGSSQSWDPMAAFYAANLGQSPFSSTPVAQQHSVMSPTAPISPWSMGPQHSSTGLDLSAMAASSAAPPPMAGSSSGLSNTGVGIEAGQDVHSILRGYYKHLYRFLPVFLPPEYIHIMANRLSADSPFILSLQAILPLLSLGEEQEGADPQASTSAGASAFGFGSSQQRKEQLIQMSAFYERKASEAIEAVLERAEGHMANGKTDSVTSQGSTLGVIQALAVLCVYHYGSGRALKARLKADQALGLCMAKGLHRLKGPAEQGSGSNGGGGASNAGGGASTKSSFVAADNDPFGSQSLFMDMPETVLYEMQKRIWWTCWSSSLWCAYNTAIVPTIRADDPRVRTEVPATSDSQAWSANVKSLQLLLLIQERVLALSNGKDLDSGSSGSGSGHQETSGGGGSGGQHARDESKSSTYAGSSMGGDATTPSASADAAFHSLPSNATRQDILDSMMDIDRNLQEQIRLIEADEDAFRKLCQEPEGIAANASGNGRDDDSPEALSRKLETQLEAYLRRSAAIQVYTSSLTLHLGQAFQGATLFERKLCFLNTIGENDSSAACQVPMPDSFTSIFGAQDGDGGAEQRDAATDAAADTAGGVARAAAAAAITNAPSATTQDLFARGPFLPRESLDRCVHASKRLLEIARHRGAGGGAGLKDVTNAGGLSEPNPFNACSFVLISFTLLMQALAVSSGSQDATSEDEVGEASHDEGHGAEAGEVSGDFSYNVGTGDGDGDFDMDDFLDGSGDLDDGPPSFPPTEEQRRPSLPHQSRSHSSADVDAFSRGVLQSAQGAAALGGGSAVASGSGTPLQQQSHPPQSGLSQQHQHAVHDSGTPNASGEGGAAGPESIDWASLLARQNQQQEQQQQQQDAPASTTAPLDITNDQRRRRREKLREIWSRVSEAHRTLVGLSRYWKMVEPMADEVSLCLETSKMLLMQ